MPIPSRLLLLAAASSLVAALACGCASPPVENPRTDYRVAEGFASRRPADIAVLPVAGALPAKAAEALRDSLRQGLLDRRFAPLRATAVDGHREDFAPGGSTAVLVVTVERWDDAALHGVGIVRMSATARLHAASTGEVLYEARLKDVRVEAGITSRTMEDRPRTIDRAAADAADRLLSDLPVKGDG